MGTESVEPTGGRRFSLIRTLGEGSFGAVYLAEMEGAGGFKRRVALKLLHETWDPASDAGRRLRDEARLLGRMEHRHIVRVDDLVQLNGRWALVMEYVSGADMERVFNWAEEQNLRVPPRAVAEIGSAIAAALEAAFTTPSEDGTPLAVVHRDIKPSNVRLAENGEIKVLDFGVARAAFAGREAKTERVRYGSLGYMAPERLLGDTEGPPGDVYALGVVVWELCTGKLYGRTELGFDQQAAQVRAAADALFAIVGDDPMVDLIRRSLAYEPDDRPSAREMEDGLREASRRVPGEDVISFARGALPQIASASVEDVRGRVLTESSARTSVAEARVNSGTLIVDPFAPIETPPQSVAVELPAPPPRSRAPAIAALGALLVAAALAAVFFWPPEPEPVRASVTQQGPPPPPIEVSGGSGVVTAPTPIDAPTEVASAQLVAPIEVPKARPSTPLVARPPTAATATPAATAPATTAVTTAVTTAAADSPTLRAAKFSLTGGDGMRVVCGGVSGSGSTSVLLRDFPAGVCTVSVAGLSTTVEVGAPRGVQCSLEGGVLQCR